MLTSTRYGVSYPNPDRSDVPDIPLHIGNVVAGLEQSAMYGQGTLAARPAFGKQGRIYAATDQTPPAVWWDTGTLWFKVGQLAAGGVGTTELADGSVVTIKLADGSVVTAKIGDGQITTIKIADKAVTSIKLEDALKPSAGAGAGTEALRALGPEAGKAAPGTHAAQHAVAGSDPIVGITEAQLAAAVLAAFVPIGASLPYAGTGDPAGGRFLLRDGRLVLQSDYPTFFGLIGHNYNGGVDPGGGQFRIPDARGRIIVGADDMGTARGAAGRLPNSNRTRGSNGGEERHVNLIAELPSHGHGGGAHGHGISDPGHLHGIIGWATNNSQGTNNGYAAGAFFVGNIITQGATSGLTTSQTTGVSVVASGAVIANEGGGAAHNNMQPYEVDNYIIRVK